METYKEYLKSHTKSELIDMLAGDDVRPPKLTRSEPVYSRPQIVWALNKIFGDFEKAENLVESAMIIIEGFKWDKFYNYDYIRFDIKKPGFSWVLIVLCFALVGLIVIFHYVITTLIQFYSTWI